LAARSLDDHLNLGCELLEIAPPDGVEIWTWTGWPDFVDLITRSRDAVADTLAPSSSSRSI
jgi:hypothetical protein